MVVQKEKFDRLEKISSEKGLYVGHVTIRQSISFLLFRLILLEILAMVGLVLSLLFFFNDNVQSALGNVLLYINIPYFVIIVFLKTTVMVLIILQWLNEYYEITPHFVIHKRGFFFKKEEKYTLAHLGKVKLEQGILGKVFNYGNVKIFNWALEKEVALYLIHNPLKAVRILKDLLPEADEEREMIREHIIEGEDSQLT